MKRIVIAAAVFLLMAAMCAFSLSRLHSGAEEYSARLDEIAKSAWNEPEERTLALIDSFVADWHEEEHRLSRLARSEKLDELTGIFSRLSALCRCGDRAEFYAELEHGRALLEHLWLSERPNAVNVL